MNRPTLQQSKGHEFTRIYAMGAARGDLVVGNEELVEAINSSDEWIRQRTGIIERRRASKDITAVDLAVEAGREAIETSGIRPDQIGAVIVATVSNPAVTPSVSALVAERVGAGTAAAYDIEAACAGYAYAIAQADALVRSGVAEYVLVIGAEKLSDFVNPADRTISFLLGDGAGAAVVGPSDFPGISKSILGSDGSKWGAVGMEGTYVGFRAGENEWPTMRQEGQTVFRWAVWEMAKVAQQALDAAGVTAADLTAFIPHQANMRIIDEFAKVLKLPDSVIIARDIATTGNTSAASIPLATHRLLAEHPEAAGGLALQIGFGAGLVFGSQVIVLPGNPPALT
ncbi:beta-ketoacyl-ACP synthase III [Subtercola boreus]|uniref:3-oxoacyl-ACP synthase n=1 Tax=Subtercola boreus TaxID=120213 RepID=A0A3E0WA78_9MICO|nr:beta-ketoacyl-ACP synthase III [Subtercola boreus]RFA20794.1 3-oxoacyl-ACP synthase [Subtercola boreus]RFA20909.1 3-oxoacyl-ACP synthase [Subtercola boreus]RFA27102.1 3-oxoacyl-ACP synthase [Subtercola boreus]